jgi:hypothetical protein
MRRTGRDFHQAKMRRSGEPRNVRESLSQTGFCPDCVAADLQYS